MIGKAPAGVALALLLAIACSCSSHAGQNGGGDESLRAQATTPAGADAPRSARLGFDLTNFTGSKLRAVYISPSDSGGWEENVLGDGGLGDGDTVDLRFSPEERAAVWDLRVEATDGHYAEWKRLDLRGASRVTLLLKLVGEPAAVAEVE